MENSNWSERDRQREHYPHSKPKIEDTTMITEKKTPVAEAVENNIDVNAGAQIQIDNEPSAIVSQANVQTSTAEDILAASQSNNEPEATLPYSVEMFNADEIDAIRHALVGLNIIDSEAECSDEELIATYQKNEEAVDVYLDGSDEDGEDEDETWLDEEQLESMLTEIQEVVELEDREYSADEIVALYREHIGFDESDSDDELDAEIAEIEAELDAEAEAESEEIEAELDDEAILAHLEDPEVGFTDQLVSVNVKQSLLINIKVSSSASNLATREAKEALKNIGQVIDVSEDEDGNEVIEFGEKFVNGYQPFSTGKKGSVGFAVQTIREYVKYLNNVNGNTVNVLAFDDQANLIPESIADMTETYGMFLPLVSNFGGVVPTVVNDESENGLDYTLEDLYNVSTYLSEEIEPTGLVKTVNVVNVLTLEMPIIYCVSVEKIKAFIQQVEQNISRLTVRAGFDVSLAYTMDAIDLTQKRYLSIMNELRGNEYDVVSRAQVEFNELDDLEQYFELNGSADTTGLLEIFNSQDLLFIKKIVDIRSEGEDADGSDESGSNEDE